MKTSHFRRPLSGASALALLLSAGACQAPARREPVLSAFAMNDIRMVEKQHWGESFTAPESYSGDATGEYALKDSMRALYMRYQHGDPADRRRLRDEIAYTFLTLIKHYHEGTTDDVYELTAAISTSFDLFAMAMGGLGAATGAAHDKSVYSALAAFGVGTRGSLARNILAEQTTQAILQQMDAMRLQQETRIRNNLKDLDDGAYSLKAVLTDLFDFYTAGSVKDAVAGLAKSAQNAKDTAKRELEDAIKRK
ncbi:MAG TPA: hypothetical protein VFF65_11620 [Phycisphaerales bacterium]|nr:hypothetical protein [Phycisphaerales bacterium]